MQDEIRNCGCNNGCGCGNNGGFLNGLFGGCGCGDSEILFFIIYIIHVSIIKLCLNCSYLFYCLFCKSLVFCPILCLNLKNKG